jgi:hypothetical protein
LSLIFQKLRNAKLLGSLYYFHSSLLAVANTTTQPGITNFFIREIAVKLILLESLNDLQNLGSKILVPLFARATKLVEQTILNMHKEDFGRQELTPLQLILQKQSSRIRQP